MCIRDRIRGQRVQYDLGTDEYLDAVVARAAAAHTADRRRQCERHLPQTDPHPRTAEPAIGAQQPIRLEANGIPWPLECLRAHVLQSEDLVADLFVDLLDERVELERLGLPAFERIDDPLLHLRLHALDDHCLLYTSDAA